MQEGNQCLQSDFHHIQDSEVLNLSFGYLFKQYFIRHFPIFHLKYYNKEKLIVYFPCLGNPRIPNYFQILKLYSQ